MTARLFIAILFDEKTVNFLDSAVVRLRDLSATGRFVRHENLHLTLVFLGQVERCRIDELKWLLAETVTVASTLHPSDETQKPSIPLTFMATGRFKQRQGDTCWVGIEVEPSLMELQGRLVAELLEAGFPVDNKPFKPHITVGRDVVLKEGLTFDRWQIKPCHWATSVNAIHLMESSFSDNHLTYVSLHEQPLFD